MSKVATTIRIEAELRASLNKICVRTGDQTYHIEQALRGYPPIKKLTAKAKQGKEIQVGPIQSLPNNINKEAWAEWAKSKGNKLGQIAKDKQWELLANYSKADQQLIINASLNSGWQGLFPLKGQQRQEAGFVEKHTDDDWKADILAADD